MCLIRLCRVVRRIDPMPTLRCKLCQRSAYMKGGEPSWLLIALWGPLKIIDTGEIDNVLVS